jgi:hypothetical protein
MAVALLPFSLAAELALDGTILMWSVGAMLALAATALLARLLVLFAKVARHGDERR